MDFLEEVIVMTLKSACYCLKELLKLFFFFQCPSFVLEMTF